MSEIKLYILQNIDSLSRAQQKELLLFINRFNSTCVKQNADGSRVNLDRLELVLLKRIECFIRNLTEYNNFYL